MDELDVAICRILFQNSRTPYSDIAEEVDLTPQAVHRRVQAMTEMGIIGGTYAHLSFRGMGRMWVVVFGWSKAPNMNQLAQRLRANHSMALLQLASGNFVYIHGSIKDVNELATFVSFVQKEAMLHEPQVGIVQTQPPARDEDFSLLDLKIVSALQGDARRSISELAEGLNTTPKTVKRRINRLVKEELVSFSIKWKPDTEGDVVTQIHVTLREDMEREKAAFALIKKLAPGTMRTYHFSNLPKHMIVTYWSKTVRDMTAACHELEAEGVFYSVVPNVMRGIHYFPEHMGRPLAESLARKQRGK
ncbi:MAG TPA: AsnC family transcriptional regulator [Methanomassiliicoccales archaeon]|nr:AsnC family transcriptional regulator [Methanomassiliicoccales archaeon]